MSDRNAVARHGAFSLLVAVSLSLAAFGQDSVPPSTNQPTGLDEGLLDPVWFGAGAPLEFRTTGQVDYLWVKSGFELRGRRVRFATWEAPRLPATRDAHDAKDAAKFTEKFPPLLRERLSTELVPPVLPVETDAEAEVVLVGRVPDCNGGAAFVWPNLVIDFKVLDARTGELLAAVHNRKVGKFQANIHAGVLLTLSAKGFQAAYASGKPATQ
jgi:hypothetical protein